MFKDYATEKPTLETARLTLRPMTAADVPDLAEWLARDEVYTYWGRKASPAEREPEKLFIDARPWVKRKPDLGFDWGIALRETGKVIGTLTIFGVENNRMAEVGYRLDPRHWGSGIATEALREAVRFLFEHTELDRLWATVDVRNTASWRVLEKNGFLREGAIRHGKMVSTFCDYYMYGLLREDVGRFPTTDKE